MKKNTLLPSLLLALASLLFLYSRLPIYMYPGEILRPLIFFWSVLIMLYLPAYWITRDWNWAGLFLVVLVLGLFCSTFFWYAYTITILSIFVLLWGVLKLILKKELRVGHVYVVLNVVSLTAILLSLFTLRRMVTTIPASYYRDTWEVVNSRKYLNLAADPESKPDIYFIVLDEYGRSDILERFYDFDNTEFVNDLRRKGFTVPEKSRANYTRTILSVTSALNMDYIDSFAPQLQDSNMRWLMSPWLDHNLVRTSLERAGYHSISISTNWSLTDNPTTDYYFKSHSIIFTEFDRYIFSVTPLRSFSPYIQKFASAPTYEAHRRSQLNNFAVLPRMTEIDGPKFVFAHIILPHPPFVFSQDGSPKNPRYTFSFVDATDYPGSTEQYREQYAEQVQFLNSQLEQVIDSILQNSTRPPIIILQADHGPRMLTDYKSVENTCLAEGFSIFSAYYLPGMEPGKIPEDITPVNIFRIILNEYFGAGLPLLNNEQYYPGDESGYYDFEIVTGLLNGEENCSVKLNTALSR